MCFFSILPANSCWKGKKLNLEIGLQERSNIVRCVSVSRISFWLMRQSIEPICIMNMYYIQQSKNIAIAFKWAISFFVISLYFFSFSTSSVVHYTTSLHTRCVRCRKKTRTTSLKCWIWNVQLLFIFTRILCSSPLLSLVLASIRVLFQLLFFFAIDLDGPRREEKNRIRLYVIMCG